MIDTSAVLAVLLDEPERPAVLSATQGAHLLAAPTLPWEIGNALIALRRRRRIESKQVQEAWSAFEKVAVRLLAIDIPEALRLAERHNLYAYDGYVLHAAEVARAPLVCLDRLLIDAAKTHGISVVEVKK